MKSNNDQFGRKIGLILLPNPPYSDQDNLDLSEFKINFYVSNADRESPNTAIIRVYNLSRSTIQRITKNAEFRAVSLNAGYEGGNYGLIFTGDIKQYRVGKENNITNYLDILAADGDRAYISSVINTTIAAGTTPAQQMQKVAESMNLPLDLGNLKTDSQHFPSIRGKVLFGMSRAAMRNIVKTLDAGWTIENGQIVVVDNTGYRDGEIVVVNSQTGLIGMPEQTDEGIRFKCLLNSRLRIGNLVRLNNNSINQIMQSSPNSANVPFNNPKGLQPLAPVLIGDGDYRVLVCESEGDTRGGPWYTNVIALAFDPTTKKTLAP